MSDLTIILTLDDNDVECCVDYTVTSSGNSGTAASLSYPGDPPEPPEWELNSITYTIGPETKELELNWDDLTEKQQELIDQTILEDIWEAQSDPYDGYDG